MNIGIIGLGKMGANMAQRLQIKGHTVFAHDRNADTTQQVAKESGAKPFDSLEALVRAMPVPRAVWVMVPAGGPTESVITALANVMEAGDTIIDGGNTLYKDDLRRAAELEPKKIQYVDVGTSGGVWGLKEGYSLMIGGSDEAVKPLIPIFESLAPTPELGWGHVGPVGAGHYTKMIHNGIEYGLMQAYAEGFELLKAKEEFNLDLHQIAEVWRYGSVVRSWLLDLTANALAEEPDLASIAGFVPDSGEGRWTVFESIDLDVPAPVITLALQQRFVSRQNESFAAKLLAAMRNQFGGHAVKKAK